MSIEQVKGVVYKIFSRPAGRGMAYSIKLDGNDNYYGTGFKMPPCKAGDTVYFMAGRNAKGYLEADINTIKVLDATPVVSSGTSVGALTKDDYWKRKEDRDLLNDKARNVGASTNTAIEFVSLLLANDAVKLPTKQGDKADAILDLVNLYAAKFRGEEEVLKAKPASPPVTAGAPARDPSDLSDLDEAGNWN